MHPVHVSIQPRPPVDELLVRRGRIHGGGMMNHAECFPNLLHHLAGRDIRAVKVKGKMPQTHLLQPAQHDLQSRALFRDKQHALSGRRQRNDEIGDGLAFARAGWPKDDPILV